jgi:hypothetical protein
MQMKQLTNTLKANMTIYDNMYKEIDEYYNETYGGNK